MGRKRTNSTVEQIKKLYPDLTDFQSLPESALDLSRPGSTKSPPQIAFDPVKQEWAGWSHRAFYSFGIGYKAEEGDCVCSAGVLEEYLTPENDYRVPVGFEAKTLEDCRRLAIAFAESVS